MEGKTDPCGFMNQLTRGLVLCSLFPVPPLACRNGTVVPYGNTVGGFVRGFRATSPLPSFAPRGLPDSEMQLQNLGMAGHSLGLLPRLVFTSVSTQIH